MVFTFTAADPDADRALLKKLMTGLPVWFDAIRDWCEVLHHQDLDYRAPRPPHRDRRLPLAQLVPG